MSPKKMSQPEKASFLKGKSWKTTAFSVTSVLTTILTLVVNPILDNDPSTNPMWSEALPVIIAGLGLLFARDDSVTSKSKGIE